ISLLYVEHNTFDRKHNRTHLHEVFVIELPNVPMELARAIRECPRFERLSLSAEDRQRSECYQKQAERELLKQTTSTREDFYRSLQQAIEIAPLDKSTLPRISQLTNKTNQFNLTTRRYTEQQIWELGSSPAWNCF